jgi:hypothetical protein
MKTARDYEETVFRIAVGWCGPLAVILDASLPFGELRSALGGNGIGEVVFQESVRTYISPSDQVVAGNRNMRTAGINKLINTLQHLMISRLYRR